jgi:bacterioferritin-associated ferredoxin
MSTSGSTNPRATEAAPPPAGAACVVCRCEEVTAEAILQVVREGARTLDEVKRVTRAGMGICQGRTCQRQVAGLIVHATGLDAGSLRPPSVRPPVRPVPLNVLAGRAGTGGAEEEDGTA